MRSNLVLLAITCSIALMFIMPAYAQQVPGKPSLDATPASSSQINLTWTVPSGSPTNYKIEVSNNGNTFSVLTQNTGAVTSYSHTNLSAGQYYYRISAINQYGTGEPSSVVFVNLSASQNIAPAAPTGVSAIAVSPNQINLSWNPPPYNGGPSVTGYRIDVKIGSGQYTTQFPNIGSGTTLSHSGLTTGTTYYYKVYAINSVGTGTASSEVSATPTSSSSSGPPNAPINLVATQINSNQIDLSWTAPSSSSPITGYKIEERVGSGSYSTINSNTGSTSTFYSRSGLSSGNTYWYRVSAISSGGTSSPSNEASPGQSGGSGVPNPPTNLNAITSSSTSLTITWTAPTGPAVTGYKIEYRVGTSGGYSTLIANTGVTTSYTHNGLTLGTTYYYKVYAINSSGTSSAAEISGKVTSSNVPTNLTVITVSPTSAKLCWFAPSETYGQTISGYKIERRYGQAYADLVEDTNSQSTSHTLNGLTTNESYILTVSAVYSLGASGRSNEVSFTLTSSSSSSASCPSSSSGTTNPPPPSSGNVPNAPTNLSAKAVSKTKVNLFWTAPTNVGSNTITGYRVEMKTGSTWTELTSNTGTTSTTYSKDGLTTGETYTFRVSAINSVGTSVPSNEASAKPTTSSTTSPPAAPTNFQVKPISTSSINMTWNAPLDNGGLDITGYKISQKVGAGQYLKVVDNTLNTKTFYVVSNLSPGTTYTYKIAAINGEGEGTPTADVSGTTFSSGGTSPCTPPQVLVNGICTTPTNNPPPDTKPTVGRVKVVDTDYTLRYEVTGAKVKSSEIDVNTNSLLIDLQTSAKGEITVTLPRALIDAKKTNDKDDEFFVLVDGEEAKFTEEVTDDTRTLSIKFPAETSWIEVYGTQSVPEFPIAALVLVAGIIATMVFSRTKLIKFPSLSK